MSDGFVTAWTVDATIKGRLGDKMTVVEVMIGGWYVVQQAPQVGSRGSTLGGVFRDLQPRNVCPHRQ